MRIPSVGTVAIASLMTLSAVGCGFSPAADPRAERPPAPSPGIENTAEPSTDPSSNAPPPPSPTASDTTAVVPEAGEVFAQPEVYSFNGLAIRGADPVAYFTEGRAVRGDVAYEYRWNGATWRFSSAENRAAFQANPAAYAPQYGGYCAWAVKSGYLASVDPDAWKIVEGKLYLNYSPRVQNQWQADVAGNIASGNQNWPTVLNSPEVSESGQDW